MIFFHLSSSAFIRWKISRPASRGWEGTHAKGSCEPGQGESSSHKRRPLVQWSILSQSSRRGPVLFLGLSVRPRKTLGRVISSDPRVTSGDSRISVTDKTSVLAAFVRPAARFADIVFVGHWGVARKTARSLHVGIIIRLRVWRFGLRLLQDFRRLSQLRSGHL